MPDGATQLLMPGTNTTAPIGEILPWLALLLALVLVGAVIISLVRKKLQDDPPASDGSFSLHELRTLHARGDLSDEEFERARIQLIERMRGTVPDKPDTN